MNKRNLPLLLVAFITLGLGVIVLLTVFRVGQEQSVAPTAPESKPKALEGIPVQECSLNFAIIPPASPAPSPQNCVIVTKSAQPICNEAEVTVALQSICPTTTTRQPLDVVLVLDTSSSMDDISTNPPQPFTDAKTAAKLLVDQLDPTIDLIGLVSYSATATLRSQLTNNFSTLKSTIDGLGIVEGTNIGDGILFGKNELNARHRANAIPILIVLSDGMPTRNATGGSCPNASTTANSCTEHAITQAGLAKAIPYTLYTVALRNNVSDAVFDRVRITMQAIATSTSQYYESPTSAELAGIFTDIATTITNSQILDLVLTDILPPGVHYVPGSATTSPTSVNGQTLTWNIGSLAQNQIQNFTFNVTFDSAGPNQLVDLFPDSKVTYKNELGNTVTLTIPETRINVPGVCVSPSPSPSPSPFPSPSSSPSLSPSPSPSPSPVVSPSPVAQCIDIRVYQIINGEWVRVQSLSQLRSGDIVQIAVLGSTSAEPFDRARFRINGLPTNWIESALTNPNGEFYYTYTLLPGVTSYTFSAEIHHPTLGWR